MSPVAVQTLTIGAGLFALGVIAFLSRRNLIMMFLAVELMLAGVATNFIGFGSHHGNYQGQLFAVLVLTLASCEAALALALVVALHRQRATLDSAAWSDLRESQSPAREESEPPQAEERAPYPPLPPAGVDPLVRLVPAHSVGESQPRAEFEHSLD